MPTISLDATLAKLLPLWFPYEGPPSFCSLAQSPIYAGTSELLALTRLIPGVLFTPMLIFCHHPKRGMATISRVHLPCTFLGNLSLALPPFRMEGWDPPAVTHLET